MTTRALLHSLLVCHLPLSTTWLVCFLSLIYFFHGTSFKKAKAKYLELLLCTHWHKHEICWNYTNQRTVGGRKHHISITLYSHGCHVIWAVIAEMILMMQNVKHDAAPLCNATHLNALIVGVGWSWVWGHLQGGVQRRKSQLQSKLTPCLSYWLALLDYP